jgi:purine-binding chemotaxis protein CheW
VPDGPAALVGLFGRGGHLVSVIDLGTALGLATGAEAGDRHLVVLRRSPLPVALRVDRAEQVAVVTPVAAGETGSLRHDAVTGHAATRSGVADQERILSLLDVDRLLHPYLSSVPVPGA